MEEFKEKCNWVPLTPAKSVRGFNSNLNPQNLVNLEESGSINFEFGNTGVGEVAGQCSSGSVSLGLHGKSEGIIGGISDIRLPQETTIGAESPLACKKRRESGLDSTKKTSSVPKDQTPKKRRKVNNVVDSNKTPRKRQKMKRHTPKVFDETKPRKFKMKPLTPKPRPPKRPIRRKTSLEKTVGPKTSVDISNNANQTSVDVCEPSCRKKISFDVDLENCTMNQIPEVLDVVEDELEVEPKVDSSSRLSSLIVYKRIFRCLKNSRKLGPLFPKILKKTRMRRKRATMFDKFTLAKMLNVEKSTPQRLVSVGPLTRKQRREANEGLSFNLVMKLPPMVKYRKKRSLILRRKRKPVNLTVFTPECKLNLNWTVYLRRKRSERASTRKGDLSSFIADISKIQFSNDFIVKASSIRTKETEGENFADCVEIQVQFDENLAKDIAIRQQEISLDNVVPSDGNILKCSTECRDSILRAQTDIVKVQNVLKTGMKEMRSYKLLFDSKRGVNYRTSDFPQRFEPREKIKIKVKCMQNFMDLDTVGPNLAAPQHEGEYVFPRQYDYALTEALVNFACKKIEFLHIDENSVQLVVRNINVLGALVPFKIKKPIPKVDLDPETMRVWNLLMENSGNENTEQEEDADKTRYWEEQRQLFKGRVDKFISRMRLVQGDRRFSPWKGSVVDSVVGVYLTQNVSDHFSSSAFMSIVAAFPPKPVSEHSGCDGTNNYYIQENDTLEVQLEIPVTPSGKCEESENYPSSSLNDRDGVEQKNENETSSQTESTSGRKEGNVKAKQESTINWDDLRIKYSRGGPRNRTALDSVDWEAVRQTPVDDLAKVIADRGMHNILARRIKDFLDRIVRDHGSIDLEWLRHVPPDLVKDYLLSIPGLGLKSVECIRLLALHHHAFPVDTNVGRILVRLGWVPLQPLPEDLQIHLLNQYPLLDNIQKYIWPRVCVRDQPTLYEAHYHMITFGKAFCTKIRPNCNACPMRGDCRHFASAYESARLRVDGPREKKTTTEESPPVASGQDPMVYIHPPMLSQSDGNYNTINCEPIVEMPASPEPEPVELQESDIEELPYESDDEIPLYKLNDEEFRKNLPSVMEESGAWRGDGDMSKALVNLSPEIASIPMPKLKFESRLRTEHLVYELPDAHPLLAEFERREPDDPCPYLLAIWTTTDETTNSSEEANSKPSDLRACGSVVTHENDQIVRGTILIPCRTANKGAFPLNGTYYQVNEVFADYESSRRPIAVPTTWIWNLKRRVLYCGTSATSISRGLSLGEVVNLFWNGFICIRAFKRATREPRSLARQFHLCKSRPMDGKSKK